MGEGSPRERGVMWRHELSDSEWGLVSDLMPPVRSTGRPARDHRTILNALMWILRAGSPWRDLPEHFGPYQTVFHRFNAWRKDGTLDRILERLHLRLDREGRLDWDLWCIDGSNVRATRAAAGAAKKGIPTNPRITRWVAREADSGPKSI